MSVQSHFVEDWRENDLDIDETIALSRLFVNQGCGGPAGSPGCFRAFARLSRRSNSKDDSNRQTDGTGFSQARQAHSALPRGESDLVNRVVTNIVIGHGLGSGQGRINNADSGNQVVQPDRLRESLLMRHSSTKSDTKTCASA